MKKFKLMYKIFAGLMISCSAFVCANATNYSSEGFSSEKKDSKDSEVKIYLTDMYGNPIDKDESEKKDKDESNKNEINLKKDKNESNKNEINLKKDKDESDKNEINLNKINFEKDKKISEDGLKNRLKKLYPKINTMMNRNGTKIQKNYKDCKALQNLHLDIETEENIDIVNDLADRKFRSSSYDPYDQIYNDTKHLGYMNTTYSYYDDEIKKIKNLFSKADSYSENDKDLINCSDQINNLFLVTKQKALNRNLPLINKIYSIFLEYVNVLDTLRMNINKLTKNSKNLNKSDEDKYLNKAYDQKKLMNDIFEKTILDFEKTFNSISKIMYGREYNLIKYFHDKDYKKIPFKEYKEYINYKDFKNFLNNEKDEDTKKLFEKLYNLIIEEIENLKTELKLYIFSQTDKKVPYKKILKIISSILNIKDNKTMTCDEYEEKYGSIKDKDKLEKNTVFFNLGSFNFDSDEKNENKNSNDSGSRSDSDYEDKYDKRYSGFDEYADEIINIDEIKDENMKNQLKNMFSSVIKVDKRVNPKNDENQNNQDDQYDNIDRLIDAMNDNMDNNNEEYDVLFTDDSDNDSDDEYNDSDDENLEKDDYKNQKKALKSLFDNSNKDK